MLETYWNIVAASQNDYHGFEFVYVTSLHKTFHLFFFPLTFGTAVPAVEKSPPLELKFH